MQSKQAWETTDLPFIARLSLRIVCAILLFTVLMSAIPILRASNTLSSDEFFQIGNILSLLLSTILVILGIAGIYFIFPFTRSQGNFSPSYGLIIPTELQAPFEVQFRHNIVGRSFQGRGFVQFAPEGLRIEGILEPSAWFKLGIVLLVTFIPLIVLKIGLGIIPGLFLANYIGRKQIVVTLPYGILSDPQIKGRVMSLTNEQVPKKISFLVARNDGERLYNEIERRYPNLILTQI